MKKAAVFSLAILCLASLLCLTSCDTDRKGGDLSGLLGRINSLSGSALTAEGFIYDAEESEYSSFLRCEEESLLLFTCTADGKGRLTSVCITFSHSDISAAEAAFAENAFDAFINSENGASAPFLREIFFYSPGDALTTRSYSAEGNGARYTLTRTESGMCISCEAISP